MTIRIAVTMGDPSGIGPEIVVGALRDLPADVEASVFGPVVLFRKAAAVLGVALPARGVRWVDQPGEDLGGLRAGKPGALAGAIQVRSLEAAMDAVQDGEAHALCTAPITKIAAREAGFPFPGHTEYLGHRTGVTRPVMMLAGDTLRVVPLTGHVPLRAVADLLTVEGVSETLVTTARALVRDFGVARPRVALVGLNPHAGEGGMLGDEERTVLGPGVRRASEALAEVGVDATLTGPSPADGLFARPEAYDAVVCAYHDQAMIPLKMRHRDDGVNVTLGLPIVRTSPAHGSALDIAWTGRADPSSMVAALRLAAHISRRRVGGMG